VIASERHHALQVHDENYVQKRTLDVNSTQPTNIIKLKRNSNSRQGNGLISGKEPDQKFRLFPQSSIR
jgi:hypothetical protein